MDKNKSDEILEVEDALKFDLLVHEVTEEIQIEEDIEYNDIINDICNKYI